MLITDINNDDYDPEEMENVSQWMYSAQENNFKLLIIKKLLLTFGFKILFLLFFYYHFYEGTLF